MEILPCQCGDYPRVRTNGGSYVHLFCSTCGYESSPFLNNFLSEVITKWNESRRDVGRQKAGAAAFDRLMNYCKSVEGTPQEDEPISKGFFSKFLKRK